MSLYGLTVEPHTPLGKWTARGDIRETPEGRYAEEFLAAHEALGAAGFEHYEVSNFARAGKRSRHNSSYWRRVPYLGVGPSAHSFDGATRRWNVREYEHWRAISMSGEDPLEGAEGLTPTNVESEGVYLGLRTSEGLTVRPEERHTAAQWVDAGWGTLNDHQLRLSAEGWLRLDSLAAALTATRSR
jgi:oxygen-independent coproporphyrinogen-3 oxidase